jgi:hypothetical protein
MHNHANLLPEGQLLLRFNPTLKMKNTSILIPIILIGCLAALGFLFYKALQTVEDTPSNTNRPIVLNEADYADEEAPTDIGTTTDYDATPQPPPLTTPVDTDYPSANNEMREMTAAEKRAAEREETLENERLERERQAAADANSNTDNRTASTEPEAAQTNDTNNGRYLVIAGSFREKLNAEERVEALISAGFKDTRLEKFNRGTFAVALAGQSDRYTEAKEMAVKIVSAGFEARVMRRR